MVIGVRGFGDRNLLRHILSIHGGPHVNRLGMGWLATCKLGRAPRQGPQVETRRKVLTLTFRAASWPKNQPRMKLAIWWTWQESRLWIPWEKTRRRSNCWMSYLPQITCSSELRRGTSHNVGMVIRVSVGDCHGNWGGGFGDRNLLRHILSIHGGPHVNRLGMGWLATCKLGRAPRQGPQVETRRKVLTLTFRAAFQDRAPWRCIYSRHTQSPTEHLEVWPETSIPPRPAFS